MIPSAFPFLRGDTSTFQSSVTIFRDVVTVCERKQFGLSKEQGIEKSKLIFLVMGLIIM